MKDLEGRVEDLEVKLAYLEHTLMQLDEMVRALGDALPQLLREVDDLRRASEEANKPQAVGHEPPPHYGG